MRQYKGGIVLPVFQRYDGLAGHFHSIGKLALGDPTLFSEFLYPIFHTTSPSSKFSSQFLILSKV